MLSHAEARDVLTAAYRARGYLPSLGELQIAGGIGHLESSYGSPATGKDGRVARYNWGMVQCPEAPPCPPGCVEFEDSRPDGSRYRWCYRSYGSHEEGCGDFLRQLYRRPELAEAMTSGDAYAVAWAGRYGEPKYHESDPSRYGEAIYIRAERIAKALGEPLQVRRGGPGYPGWPTPSDATGVGALVCLGISIAILLMRQRKALT